MSNVVALTRHTCRIEEQILESIREDNEAAFGQAIYAYDLALSAIRNAFNEHDVTPSSEYAYRSRQRAMLDLLAAWNEGQKLTGTKEEIWRDPAKLLALQASARHAVSAVRGLMEWEMRRELVAAS